MEARKSWGLLRREAECIIELVGKAMRRQKRKPRMGSAFPQEIRSKRDVIGFAIDLAWPVGQPGQFVAVRISDYEEGRSSVEGWRSPEVDSEDYPRLSLDPIECSDEWHIDQYGFWECQSWEPA